MRAWLHRIDEAVFKVEALLCVVFLALMSALVFLDVVHRVASAPQGRLAQILSGFLGGTPAADATISDVVSPAITACFWLFVIYAALRTAKLATPVPKGKAAGISLGAVVILWGALKLYVLALPNGVVWAQPVALAMMLWTGFLGASVATKMGAHIVLEVMEFVIPAQMKPLAAGLGNLVASLFFGFLVVISYLFVRSYFDEWIETDGQAGVIEGLPIPRFVVYGILPVSFTIMALRFLSRSVIGLSGREPPRPDDERPRDQTAPPEAAAAGEGG